MYRSPRGAGVSGRHQQGARPGVTPESFVDGDRARSDCRVPVAGRRRRLALVEDEVEDAVEEVVLVGDVVVERHRLEPERLAELAHRQRLDPALVGELERRLQDPVAAEGEARALFAWPLTNLTLYVYLTP